MNDWNGEPAARPPAGPAAGHPLGADEETLREALRRTASAVRPTAWPERAVLERARRRRSRQITMTVPLVAAAAVGAVLMAGRLGPVHDDQVLPAASSDPPRPVVTPPPAPSTTPDPSVSRTPSGSTSTRFVWPKEQVATPGQVISVGHGARLRLDPTQRCVDFGGPGPTWNCKSVVDGNQPQGNVGIQAGGNGLTDLQLYTPLYIGSGRPARMTVTVGGQVFVLHVVTLGGDPGYATGYGWGPALQNSQDSPGVAVYDEHGHLLAKQDGITCVPSVTPDPDGGQDGECLPTGS